MGFEEPAVKLKRPLHPPGRHPLYRLGRHARPRLGLILETKGHDELKDVKTAAAERWVHTVNAEGQFGTWVLRMATKVSDVGGAIGGVVAEAR